jgi:carbamoyltransferase
MTSSQVIAGIKLTHDGAVAVVRDNVLVSVVECEKVASNPRYAAVDSLEQIPKLLAYGGSDVEQIDTWVLDGWFTQAPREKDPHVEVHTHPVLVTCAAGAAQVLPVAAYREMNGRDDPLAGLYVARALPGLADTYRSHHHTTGHLASGYCTSPYAAQRKPAVVVVWDGGVSPRLYVVDPVRRAVGAVGPILPLKGSTYATVVSRFPPFRLAADADSRSRARHELSIPGKAMAYAGLGAANEALYASISGTYRQASSTMAFDDLPGALADAVECAAIRLAVPPADAIHTWQEFASDLFSDALADALAQHGLTELPLVLTGGCALNISWNSRIRDDGRFGQVWVPPFPNDSGSALGSACAEMMRTRERWHLDWDVYRGPVLMDEPLPPGWTRQKAGPANVARLLHDGNPVAIIQGRAELGPRALGHRSILAAATSERARDFLNEIKQREFYRPVAPVCRAERASEVFDPGGHDPFMLFQHRVNIAWRDRIPAVVHADGTARLQTVARQQEPLLYELLLCYEQLSGIPVLCNTSANLPGRGFFPSIAEVLRWGRVRHVWSSGVLYSAI